MKAGGPWNFRGLRPRAREAALDAARQSGISVGEWLNSVVESDDADTVDGQPPRPHDPKPVEFSTPPRRPGGLQLDADGNDRDEPRRDPQDEDRREHRPRRGPVGFGAPHRRHGGPYRDPHSGERNEPRRDRPEANRPERDPRREAVESGAPDRRNGGPYRDTQGADPDKPSGAPDEPGGDEFDQVNDRLDKLTQQLEQYRDARETAQRRDQFSQVNDRIDKLTQQLERLAQAEATRQEAAAAANTPAEPHEPPLNSAAALPEPDEALSQETATPKPQEPPPNSPPLLPPVRIEAVRQEAPAVATPSSEPQQPALRAVAAPRRREAPAPMLSIDDAIAEIAARQRALDGEQSVAAGVPVAPTALPASESALTIDFSALQSQLRELTTRIEALKPTSDITSAITALRGDLADIGRQLNEALPRRAVESLETEIKALSERIDRSRQAGIDPNALVGLERGLAEVREALHGLTPAESLAGFNEAVGALAQKVDMILARDDPAALQQLETAIGGLRGVVSHVASNDTLARVAEDVRALAAQVDGIANNAVTGHAISALEQRIDTLVDGVANNGATGHAISALEQRIDTLAAALHASSEASQAVPRDLEKLLAGLIDKLEWVQLTHTDHAALAHLEDRIAMLVKRFDASEARLNQFEAVERGLADLLVHVEQLRGYDDDAPRPARRTPAPVSASAITPDVDGFKQSDRRGDDTLEARHDPAEHVDHLAAIESNLYDSVPPYDAAMPETQSFDEATLEPQIAPDPISPPPAPAAPAAVEAATAIVPLALAPLPPAAAPAARPPIDPSLPPHYPLEPGSAGARSRPSASAAERVAASEAAIASTKPPVIADSGRPNFIAAARRAAQAAAWEPPGAKAKAEPSAADQKTGPSKRSQRLRKLVMAGSALLIVVGCLRIAIRLFDDNRAINNPVPVQSERAAAPVAPTPAPITKQAAPASGPAAAAPPVPPPDRDDAATPQPEPPTAPAKAAKPPHESLLQDGQRPAAASATKADGGQPTASALPLWATPDITGTLPHAISGADNRLAAADAVATDDKLPAAIGDPALRQAALGGNPAAAYEVAARFAEGHGVPQNQVAAAHWLERAAERGLVPAQFRLGGLYEKGIGVKKDLTRARELYLAAAEKGNGKAMHNLAVLYAEGIDGAPDYKDAAQWFGKAANHGLRDSQYNLGILYARGIGVSQNYADSYKWFALAAAQGDHDAATKRDDVATHLSAQALAAARLAVKNFTPEPQPDDAINVRTAAAWQPPAKPQHPAQAK